MLTQAQISLIAKHYIQAGIWADAPESETDDEGNDTGVKLHYEPAAETQANAEKIVSEFYKAHSALVDECLANDGYGDDCAQDFGGQRRTEWPFASFGHDLYLTQRGHGVGFLDRGLGVLGVKLADKCDALHHRAALYNCEPEFYEGLMYLHICEPRHFQF
jgi:hypothetical protein